MKRIVCAALLIITMAFLLAAPSFGGTAAEPLVMDVRTEAEWTEGHLEGAILIPYDQIGGKIGAVSKEKSRKIYVYCRTGNRSAIAKKAMEKMGYTDVVDLGSLGDAARALKRNIVK